MCGRFTRLYTWEQLVRLYRLTLGYSNLQPRYNICPTTTIDTVVEKDGARHLEPMRWGLIPAWWSKPLKEMKLVTFNARSETVDTKPMFRAAFKKNRCIIPASGYYEWQTIGKEKLPWYFTAKHEPILSIAGIWNEWTDRVTGKPLKSCCMLITEPNKLAAEIHDRMPVLLQPKQFEPWLCGEMGKGTLTPAPDDLLQKVRVSSRVNSSRAPDDDASLIESLAGSPQ
jgi:putative SOS response-associated peptidase YedK